MIDVEAGKSESNADVRLAQAGDLAAFGRLVNLHQNYIYRISLSMLRHEADAEDAAQETFFRAFKSLKRCRDRNAFRAWLTSIAANTCRDELRSRKRRKVETLAQPVIDALADSRATDAEARMIYLQATERVLSVLNAKQRAVLTLIEGMGASYEETAASIGVSVSAVKSMMWRSRDKIAKSFPEMTDR